MTNTNIAFYIRLSRADEDIQKENKKESNSIINQRKYLNDFIKEKKEFENSNVIEFVDDGYTAINDNRPRLKLMLEKATKREIDIIIVRDFSRFFRSYIDAGYYLEKEFPTLGVRFISVNDNYDSNNFIGTTGGMEMVIRNIVYSAYSKDLSLKIKSVKKQMMNDGKFTGGLPPYGYIRNPENKHKLIIDNVVSHNIKRIFDLAIEGYKLAEIANLFNEENIESPKIYRNRIYNIKENKENIDIWKYTTIYRILTNEMYLGNMINGKEKKVNLYAKKVVNKENLIIVDSTHKGIVSRKDFENAQKVIMKKSNMTSYNNELYPLKSLLKCGECNKSLYRDKRKKISNLYKCRSCRSFNKQVNLIKEDELEKDILQIILKYVEVANKKNINKKDRYIVNEKTIDVLEAEKFNLYKKYSRGNITSEVYLNKKESIDKRIDTYKNSKNNNIIVENNSKYNLNCNKLTYNMAHSFIEKILVYNEKKYEVIMKFGDIIT